MDHAFGWQAGRAVESAVNIAARHLNVDSDEIILTSGATEANNLTILGLARRAPNTRRRILISAIEHKCVTTSAASLERPGISSSVNPIDRTGAVDVDGLHSHIDEDVLLLSVMAVNNESGTVQDIETIAELADAHGTIFTQIAHKHWQQA